MPPNNQYNNMPVMPQVPQAGLYGSSNKTAKSFARVALIFTILGILFISLLVFGFWSFSKMQDYKNNSDKKSDAAVKAALINQEKDLQSKFNEQEKSPYKSYSTPSQYASVKIIYPKTWSSYVVEQSSGSGTPIDGYFNPDFVPGTNDNSKTSYILRVQISNNSYNNELKQFDSFVKQGKTKVSPYVPVQVTGATPGVRIDGQISTNKKGAMVIVPVRDKILKVWTEQESVIGDFNNIVVKNLSYSP